MPTQDDRRALGVALKKVATLADELLVWTSQVGELLGKHPEIELGGFGAWVVLRRLGGE